VNMQSLPRSSETAEQRPISERTRSQRRRSAETNAQTAARLSARRISLQSKKSCLDISKSGERPALYIGPLAVAIKGRYSVDVAVYNLSRVQPKYGVRRKIVKETNMESKINYYY